MLSLVHLNGFSFVTSPKLLAESRSKDSPLFLQNYQVQFTLRNKSSSSVAPLSCAQNVLISNHKVDDDEEEEDVKYSTVGLRRGESMIPKHVATSLDGNRRWLKIHGLDLDYKPFFQANMKFVEYCLKWGVGTGTSYMYGLGNMKHRTKETNDLFMGQFERFLEEGLEIFMRKGVKVSVVGEKWMLSESCQATIKQVEEATKNNTNLDFMLPICYTSQRDIVQATRKICRKVKEGTMELEDINEELFEQHLSICGSRPPLDLFIRTGGQLRIGMLLAWQVPHTELYFTDIHAPDFGEDVFLDALRAFQQRVRMFGK